MNTTTSKDWGKAADRAWTAYTMRKLSHGRDLAQVRWQSAVNVLCRRIAVENRRRNRLVASVVARGAVACAV